MKFFLGDSIEDCITRKPAACMTTLFPLLSFNFVFYFKQNAFDASEIHFRSLYEKQLLTNAGFPH